MPATDVVLWHLGKMHPFEHVLVYLLAFGPLLLLVAVVRLSRGRNEREEREEGESRANG